LSIRPYSANAAPQRGRDCVIGTLFRELHHPTPPLREAVAAAVRWWTDAVPGGGPLVAVTQKANRASCRMLEAIGMTVVDELDEHGARQCLYTPAGDQEDSDLRWFRLLAERRDAVERRRARPGLARAFPTI